MQAIKNVSPTYGCEALTPEAFDYACLLIEAGFRVMVYDGPARSSRYGQSWFYYSRKVGPGLTCWGYYESPERSHSDHSGHGMPVVPSKEFGSSVIIAPRRAWPSESVEMARDVASPKNVAPYCGHRVFDNYNPLRSNAPRGELVGTWGKAHFDLATGAFYDGFTHSKDVSNV